MNAKMMWVGGLAMALFLAFAVVLVWLGLREQAAGLALADHGVTIEARIEGLRTETRTRRTNDRTTTETVYEVTYAFEAPVAAGGEPVAQRVERDVPHAVFRDLHLSQAVEIRYLPENPSRIDFYPGQSAGSATILFLVAGIFVFAILLFAGIFGWIALSLRRMARDGVTTTGGVVAVRHGTKGSTMEVRFRDGMGEARTASVALGRGSRWAGLAPGATVSLRYLPDKPSRVTLVDPALEPLAPGLEPAIRSL
jgi:hypothetical protein